MVEPRNYADTEILKDGTGATIRAIRPDDRDGILAVFNTQDRQSVYTRFFGYKKGLTDSELSQLTQVDFDHVVALVVTVGSGTDETIIAGGRYLCASGARASQSAELAFTTDGNYQGRGIANLALRHLTRIARERGVSQFEADVLAQNEPMLAVFRRSELPMLQRRDGDVVHVTLSLTAASGLAP